MIRILKPTKNDIRIYHNWMKKINPAEYRDTTADIIEAELQYFLKEGHPDGPSLYGAFADGVLVGLGTVALQRTKALGVFTEFQLMVQPSHELQYINLWRKIIQDFDKQTTWVVNVVIGPEGFPAQVLQELEADGFILRRSTKHHIPQTNEWAEKRNYVLNLD